MKTVAYRFAFLHRALMLIGIMLCTLTVHATTFITDVKVIGGTKDETKELKETLTKQGWIFIDYDLNKGASGDYIYLLYKADENTDGVNRGYITDFYISNEGDVADDSHTVDGRTYYLTDYEGGEHFKEKKGDLNSGTGHGSANIHLYYTKDLFTDYRAITGITFNDTQDGAVGLKGGTTGYDLNEDCGSGTDYIYMHITTATVSPEPVTVTIGNGTYTSCYIPFVMDANYFLTEQIYTAEEIGMAGTITSIAFQYASSGAFSMSGVQVYLKHTEQNEFGNMVPLSAEDKVFEGTFSATDAGWATIIFDTPFEYDGNGNLLVCCYDPTDGNLGTDYIFYRHNPGSTKMIRGYSNKLVPSLDGANWIINLGVITETSFFSRNNIRFNIIPGIFSKPENLTVSSCTEETATISWTTPETAITITGYGYQFKKASDASWSAEVTTTDTTATFSNLTADTDYDFRVRTLYGSNKSSYKTLHFTTATPLPYEQGFENGMGRWGMVDVNWGKPRTEISAKAKHDGENGFMFYPFSTDPKPQYLISPRFADDVPMTVMFYYKAYSLDTFQVGYSTTTSDVSAFTWGEEITSASDGQWKLYEKNFPVGTKFIAVKYINNYSGLYLDDFTFMAYSGPKPTDLAVSSCTEQTATLTWTAPQTDKTITGYAYQYKKGSDASWSDEVTTTATTATISNLTPDTDYDFLVRTLYGSNKSSYQTLHFTSATPLPYEQDFENGMGRWGMVDVDWGYTGINAEAKHDGENGFEFSWFSSGEHGPQYLISPRFSGNEGLTVSFYHYNKGTTEAKFKIGYSTTSSDPAAFTWAEEITPVYSEWNRAECIFPEGTSYVAISFDYIDKEYAHVLLLDDFSIDEYSPYAKPVNVTVSNLTDSKATLSWTAPDGSPTGYAYQYRKLGDSSWSAETNVSGTSVTLSSLSADTTYDFRVKARYSGGKASNYVTFRFMTEAAMVSLPFTDGFENGIGGWRIVDGRTRTDICADNVRNGTSAFMFQGQADEPQYLMSPWFDGSTDMNVSFWYKNYIEGNTSYPAGFQVGYSTTSRDTTAFIWSELIKSTHEWQQYSANFPSGTRFVAVKWVGGYWLYLDDFSFNGPPTTLSSADDWDLLARFVEGGWTAEGVTIKMTDDFTATKTIGNAEHPFCGTFDGQGHTLTLNISSSGRVAPFLEINGATIKNLKVTGDMIAGGVAYSGGLVGCIAGGTNLIQNCVVDALISMSDPEGGGIVGYVNNADITIEGCVFTGFLYNNGLSLSGAMYATTLIGYADGNPSVILLKNCLDASNMTGPLGRGAADPITNCYYTRDEKSSYSNQGGWISPARQAISTDTPPANIGQPGTDYGFVQAYSNGLKYNGKYYMALSDFEDNPTDVPFIPYPAKTEDKQEGSWYTIDGRLLEQAPTAPGLYMHNSETILLK